MEKNLTKQTNGLTLVSDESLQKFNLVQDKITELQRLDVNEMSQMAIAAAKANIIAELKKALDNTLVGSIKGSLENNRLGFKTDKVDGYSINEVRTALIESAIDGFYWHGNEFNIIGGNAYYTKEGFTNKIKRTQDFTNLIINMGIPRNELENKRAIIKVDATWNYKNKPMSISKEFSIKLTIDKFGKNWTTDDAIAGKAERKIKAKIYEESTGSYFPEADANEINQEIKFQNAKNISHAEIKEKANIEEIDFSESSAEPNETEQAKIQEKELADVNTEMDF